MPVPLSEDHRVRMMVWGWAIEGYGREDIEHKLKMMGLYFPPELIWKLIEQAQKVKR